jgi:P2-related tail formation protein
VNRPGDQFFSSATLTSDQNSGIAWSHSDHLRGYAADSFGRTDDVLEHGRRQNLVAKVERLIVDPSDASRAGVVRSVICKIVEHPIRPGARTQATKSI